MSKTEKEMIEKNIELSTEFSRYLFDHTNLDESIPTDAEIVFLPEFDTELKDFNIELGKKLESARQKVVYIKIRNLRPKILSRIQGVSLSLQASG
jgi:hypothetical protein